MIIKTTMTNLEKEFDKHDFQFAELSFAKGNGQYYHKSGMVKKDNIIDYITLEQETYKKFFPRAKALIVYIDMYGESYGDRKDRIKIK